MLYVILLIFLSMFFLAVAILPKVLSDGRQINRMNKYVSPEYINAYSSNTGEKRSREKHTYSGKSILKLIGKNLGRINVLKSYTRFIQKDIIRAGILIKGEEFLAFQLLISIIVVALTYNIRNSIAMSLPLGLVAGVAPLFYIGFKKKLRLNNFSKQLSDTIVLISNSLKAGHSFLQAIEVASNEMPDPISREFRILINEMQLGISTEEALTNLSERVENEDLELLVTAVLIQRQIGGNLSEILDNISSTIRGRVKLKGEISALTAQGRMSGIIVSLLPFALAGLLIIINPTYFTPMISNPIGIIMMLVGIVSEVIGMLLIKKIVDIKL